MTTRRLYLVDDHDMFTEAMALTFSNEPDMLVVGRSTTHDAGMLDRVARLSPDVILLDVEQCGDSTTAVVAGLLGRRSDAHVLVLTGSVDQERMIDAARAGADAWVSKGSSTEALVATVRAVCAGHACFPEAHLGAVLRALRGDAVRAVAGVDPLGMLSRQERRVLAGMVEGVHGAQIAAELQVSAGTIRSHSHSIYTKLGVHSRLEAVTVARSVGMLPLAPNSAG